MGLKMVVLANADSVWMAFWFPLPFTRGDKRFGMISLVNAAEGECGCCLRVRRGEPYDLQDRDGTRSNSCKLAPN